MEASNVSSRLPTLTATDMTLLIGCASIAADREQSWWRRRRLRKVTGDLAAISNEYTRYLNEYHRTEEKPPFPPIDPSNRTP